MESQYEHYQNEAELEIANLSKVVEAKEQELMLLQRNLDKVRGNKTATQSGFSMHN